MKKLIIAILIILAAYLIAHTAHAAPLYRYVPEFVQPQAQPTPYVYQQPAYQQPVQQYNNTYHDTYEYHAPAQTLPQYETHYDSFAMPELPDLSAGF